MTDFTTKDSGERQEWSSGMHRDTETGKPRFDLIVPEGVPFEEQLLTRFANLMARGAEKYTERNWEQANSMEEVKRAESSAYRHFMQWLCGETDEDHAAAVIFNLMVVETTLYKISQQDAARYKITVSGFPIVDLTRDSVQVSINRRDSSEIPVEDLRI